MTQCTCVPLYKTNKLQLIQNGACRTILKVPKDTHVEDMHQTLGLPTLAQRREAHLATECYKSVTTPDSGLHYMFNLIGTNRRSTRLASNMGITVPRLNTSQGRKAFRYRGPTCWNGMEPNLKTSESLAIFKSNMMKKLLRDVNHPG